MRFTRVGYEMCGVVPVAATVPVLLACAYQHYEYRGATMYSIEVDYGSLVA